MRATSGLFVVIALTLTTGCGGSPTTPPGGGLPRLPEAGNIGGKIKEAGEQIKGAAAAGVEELKQQRDQLVNSVKPKLEEVDKKVEELKKQASTATGEQKQKLQDQIDKIKEKREAVDKKLAEVKEAAAERWVKVKEGFDQAMKDLQDAVK
jgi:TolA-binding protein